MSLADAFASFSSMPVDVPRLVETVLSEARTAGASDIHLVPTADALAMKWRLDGVLQRICEFPRQSGPQVIARLKVLADLLTYRTEIPQEGRIRPWRDDDNNEKLPTAGSDTETRLSTFPTLFGEKAVIRLFVGAGRYRRLDELSLPTEVVAELRQLIGQTDGVILLTGPAGSGKTTTAYATLREIIATSAGQRSVVTLEDPIEVVVPGADQTQVNPNAGFDLATGLKSVLRQDPDTLLVGEIRDRETAETVFQASLTGHLVMTTFHAGSAVRSIGRLLDMDIEPYLLRSGLAAVLCQRLMRRLCECAEESRDSADRFGLPVETVRKPIGCEQCRFTGYAGRFIVTEFLDPERHGVGPEMASHRDSRTLEKTAEAHGLRSLRDSGLDAVRDGRTSPAEFLRIFGSKETR
ncbi:GspE/PulE family protein [Thalassoroseus pseudoceratinae]|uniref:GspE/PulE family protein n=1 Tax=Thalassoroseus pseudoceratinae TaxID=2713176 RepID=UPI0014222B77|nr:GspE/PulE family protein [Thalassoroseus pseudoceratinae]